jgi:hypothetical protein
MPFDNPCQMPFGDLELIMEVRGCISSRTAWVQGHFRKEGRYCLVAALSLTCGSRSFAMPNPTERRLARLITAEIPPNALFCIRPPSCLPDGASYRSTMIRSRVMRM